MAVINTPSFIAYYNALAIPKPPLATFNTLAFLFRLGTYLDFTIRSGYLIVVAKGAYAIQHLETTETHKTVECELDLDLNMMFIYEKAVNKCLEIIEKPF